MRDKVAIVTGGAGLIGSAIVGAFHGMGAKVCTVDQDHARMETAYGAAGVPTSDRLPIMGDVAEESVAEQMVNEAVSRFGRLDSVVTCAYWNKEGTATDITLEEWNRCLAVSLTPTFLAAKHALPAIRDTARHGSLIAISSIHGSLPAGCKFMYATAKAALEMLVRSLAVDLTSEGLRVNCVAPGGVVGKSELFAPKARTDVAASYLIGRYVEPDDIASAVLFLCSEQASAIAGHVLTVDGGTTIPLQDWLLHEVTRRSSAL